MPKINWCKGYCLICHSPFVLSFDRPQASMDTMAGFSKVWQHLQGIWHDGLLSRRYLQQSEAKI